MMRTARGAGLQASTTEAAHIIPDTEPDSPQIVPNGLSLCRLHPAALDRLVLGIRPEYTVGVRPSIPGDTDGPLLRPGLQVAHYQRIWTLRHTELKSDPELLE